MPPLKILAQARASAFGCAEVEAFGNPGYGQDCFGSQTARDRHFRWVAFQPHGQVGLGPAGSVEFFGDDPFGFGFGALMDEFARIETARGRFVNGRLCRP